MLLKRLHLYVLPVVISGLIISACTDVNETAFSVPEFPPVTSSPQIAPLIQSTQTEEPANHMDAPRIIKLIFPESVRSGMNGEMGEIHFSDGDGDIHSAQFMLLEGGCMDFEYSAFNPMTALSSGNRFSGIFHFRQTCKKCRGSAGDLIRMRVQLYDRAGNESESNEYTFLCQ